MTMKHPQLNTLLHIGESNFYSLMSDSNRKLMAYDFKKKKISCTQISIGEKRSQMAETSETLDLKNKQVETLVPLF